MPFDFIGKSSILRGKAMKYVIGLIFSGVLWSTCGYAAATEPWQLACTTAMTLLKQAQREVRHRHDQIKQAKVDLMIPPVRQDFCRTGRRGYMGGQIYCVRHHLKGTDRIHRVMEAEQALAASIEFFNLQVREFKKACLNPS